MAAHGHVKQYLLFVAPTALERKNYVASYKTREQAIRVAETLKIDQAIRWQVFDKVSGELVAEDPGK